MERLGVAIEDKSLSMGRVEINGPSKRVLENIPWRRAAWQGSKATRDAPRSSHNGHSYRDGAGLHFGFHGKRRQR